MSMAERKNLLLEMQAEAEERLRKAQADYDAMVRVLAFHDEISLPEPSKVEGVRTAAIEVLVRSGKPIHRQEILNELGEMGIRVSGKEPVNNLGSVLSRFSDEFQPHGNGVWGLKGWSIPSKPTDPVLSQNGNVPVSLIPPPVGEFLQPQSNQDPNFSTT